MVATSIATAAALSLLMGVQNAQDTITNTNGGYYKVVLPQASTLLVRLDSMTTNLDLEIVNSSGTVITDANSQVASSSNPDSIPEQVEAYNLASGTYYLHVKNPTGATSAPYHLSAKANLSPDILWRNKAASTSVDSSAGQNVAWRMGGAAYSDELNGTQVGSITGINNFISSTWQVAGSADFNGDGYNDLVWRDYSSGANSVWLMNSSGGFASSVTLPTVADANWALNGVGDFNADGKPDLVWRYQGTGTYQGNNVIWLMNGISSGSLTINSTVNLTTVSDLNWRIGGVGDFNLDGNPDIVFQNSSSGAPSVVIWTMNGTSFVSSAYISGVTVPAAPWYVFGTGYYDNDEYPDIFWSTLNGSSEQHAVWTMNGTAFKGSSLIGTALTSPNWLPRGAYPEWTTVAPIDEAGDTNATAKDLGTIVADSFNFSGYAGTSGDQDVYKFAVGSTRTLTLTATSVSSNALSYTLKNSAGTTVATANSSSSPTVSVAALPADTYYLSVAQSASTQSRYSFNVNITAPTAVLTATNDPGSDGLTVVNSLKVGGTDYFLAVGNSPGLYKTDGTVSGTVQLSSLSPAYPYDLVNLSGTIFFEATGTATGTELYKTDGTVSGTVVVKDIQSGVGSASPSGLTVLGTKVYFSADDGTYGQELWSSDGTSSGTTRVANINTQPVTTGTATPDLGSFPSSIVAMGTSLYFAADDGTTGNELWKYNGTTTSQVKDLYTGSDTNGVPFASSPTNLTVNGSNLYFSAYTPATGTDLFVSDGTSTGTVAVDINNGAGDANPSFLTVMGSNLYAAATDSTHGNELFKVSGSTATLVSDLNTSGDSSPEELTAIGSTLWFTAQKSTTTGYEVFRTDGSTILNSGNPWDVNPGAGSSNAGLFTQIGSDVYFTADNGTNGYELMKSAGGTGTPALFKNINTVPTTPSASTDLGSFPYFITPLSSSQFVFFAATNDIGTQLYNSDTTAANTAIVKKLDATARVAPSLPVAVDGANGVLLSLRYTPNEGQELYAGSTLLKDINLGPGSSQVSDLTVFNGASYFSAFDGTSTNLWVTDGVDGTTAHTHKVTAETGVPQTLTAGRQLPPITGAGTFSDYTGQPIWMRGGNGVLFYTVPVVNGANTEIHLKSLSTSGLVTDIKTLNTTGTPVMEMVATDNGLLFASDDGTHGMELWQSDGTASGTFMLRDVNPGAAGSYPYSIQGSFSDNFYFDQFSGGYDGSGTNNHIVSWYSPAFNSPLSYFLADDGTGVGLYSTDGMPNGSVYYPRFDLSPQGPGAFKDFLYGRNAGTFRITEMDYSGSSGFGNNMEFSGSRSISRLLTAFRNDSVAYEPNFLRRVPQTIFGFPATSGTLAPDGANLKYKVDSFDLNLTSGGGSGATGFTEVNPSAIPSVSTPAYTVFNADNGSSGNELFVAKKVKNTGFSTASGTCYNPGDTSSCLDNSITMSLAVDLFTGNDVNGNPNSSNPRDFVYINNAVYFLADTASGTQLFQVVTNGASGVTTTVYATLPTGNTPISLALQGSTLKVTARYPVSGASDQFKTFDLAIS